LQLQAKAKASPWVVNADANEVMEAVMPKDICCPNCGKLLARDVDDVLVVANGGGKNIRIYGAVAVAFDCSRCGRTVDLPKKMPVKAPSR